MDRRDGVYHIDGLKVPSTTDILQVLAKPALIQWAAKQAAAAVFADPQTYDTAEKAAASVNARKGEAADRGKAVHNLIEEWTRGRLDAVVMPPDLMGYVEGFRMFVRAWNPQTLYTECLILNKTHGYAGRVDWIGTIGDQVWMIDFKTSKAVWPEFGLQLTAYKNAEFIRRNKDAELEPMPKVDHTGVVLIPGNGGFDFKSTDEPLDVFLALKQVHAWSKLA